MRRIKWSEVEDTSRLQPGGYVVRIDEVRDYPESEYLEIVYDVAEGARAGYYSSDWGRNNPWAHSQRVYYTERSTGVFRGFLGALEASNLGFAVADWDVTCDPFRLRGLVVGALIQYREYVGRDGETKQALEIARFVDADKVRGGEYKLPPVRKPKDAAQPAPAPAVRSYADVDVPF